MRLIEFFYKVEEHPDLKGVSINDKRVLVNHLPTNVTISMPLSAIQGCSWKDLEDSFCGRRESQVLRHLTRVVGYYSRVENWNASKIGELKDRQKGNYVLPEGEPDKTAGIGGTE